MDCTLFVALSQGMVFLLHKYFCRKIVSRHSDVIKVQVGGGKPDTDVIAKVSVIIVLVALAIALNIFIVEYTTKKTCLRSKFILLSR